MVTYIGSTVYGPNGVYAGSATALGKVLVRTRNSPQFNQFSYPITASGWIDFAALLPGSSPALYRMTTSGAALQTVANLNSNLTLFHRTTAAGSIQYNGVFSSCHGTWAMVLADGDTLNGVKVAPRDRVSTLPAVPSTTPTTHY